MKITEVDLYNITDQPIVDQPQAKTDKSGNQVGEVVIASPAPGVTMAQENGSQINRYSVFDIGSLTEYIHIDGANHIMQSSNFLTGTSGWIIRGDGSVEFASGYFRGDITGASGTFSGTVTGAIANLGGFQIGSTYIRDAANSFGLSSTVTGSNDVRFWSGTTLANIAVAPLRIYEDGSIIASNIQATGAIFATSGWIGSATALVYESQGINTGTTGWIRGGQTGYNTGTGYFLGYSSGTYKFSIGDTTTTNSLLWDGSNLSINGSILSNQNTFGDGSDGDITYSGNTTLTADVYAGSATVNNGITLSLGGYRLFVKNTLTNNGTISVAGGNGGVGTNGSGRTQGTGGAAGTAGGGTAFLSIGLAGKIGSDGGIGGHGGSGGNNGDAGTSGSAVSNAFVASGKNGGSSGGGGSSSNPFSGGGGASGGTGGTATLSGYTPRNATELTVMRDYNATTAAKFTTSGGSGSGAGGGGGAGGASGADLSDGGGGGGGGGSGGNGGIGVIFARILTNNGTITANGGNGGAGGNGANGTTAGGGAGGGGGGGGGGGAGNGGVLVLVYSNLTLGTVTVTAGSAGAAGSAGLKGAALGSASDGGAGSAGVAGTAGVLLKLQV